MNLWIYLLWCFGSFGGAMVTAEYVPLTPAAKWGAGIVVFAVLCIIPYFLFGIEED